MKRERLAEKLVATEAAKSAVATTAEGGHKRKRDADDDDADDAPVEVVVTEGDRRPARALKKARAAVEERATEEAVCGHCGLSKPKGAFSKSQWKKDKGHDRSQSKKDNGPGERKCMECVKSFPTTR